MDSLGYVAQERGTRKASAVIRVSGKIVAPALTVVHANVVSLDVVLNVVMGVARLIRNAQLDNTVAIEEITAKGNVSGIV